MAGLYCCIRAPHLMRLHGLRCSSSTPHNNFNKNMNKRETQTPQILKLAVSGVTELLRLFSSSRSERVDDKKREEISVSGVNDVVMILKSDYENAYFVTGKALYSRNLKLLVPFFDRPSIGLQKIDKGINSKTNFVLATWKLRTYLKLPWKPLICIDGSTVYELDDKFNIVRHAESWNVSALEAIGQIFTPSFGRPND
ncbi:uncharacterized protein LOC133883117 isoform X3 [Alnus glutinosa]|uniref:uncharacterized protein LOC133883117 isoform X3 n=1 Tax=Alnus glutinosa TaxID=3517 RepID=UPI002D783E65|nr:uncharacterized protein LOC133883117 isoform X3 [Alnus glutinosa]